VVRICAGNTHRGYPFNWRILVAGSQRLEKAAGGRGIPALKHMKRVGGSNLIHFHASPNFVKYTLCMGPNVELILESSLPEAIIPKPIKHPLAWGYYGARGVH
jgi:hypothetical protein